MITGFISGNGFEDTIVIRALGPSLDNFGIAGLSDPRLDLYDGDGNLLASNDNWQDSQAAEIEATGLAPSDPLEAAILITLPRGAYTAVLSPVDGGSRRCPGRALQSLGIRLRPCRDGRSRLEGTAPSVQGESTARFPPNPRTGCD
jgi:hypothetical protein